MAIWIAISILAGVIFLLGIFYLVNSVHHYGKWIAPAVLMIVSLAISVGSGWQAYQLHQADETLAHQPSKISSATNSSSSGMVANGVEVIDDGIKANASQQEILKDLQESFKQVGTVSFDEGRKTFVVTPTTDQDVKAINYVLENPNKADESGYTKLTDGILKTSSQLTKPLGNGYTIQLTKPNNNEVIYAAQDGKVQKDLVKNTK